ncbi:hypothetical protein PHLGIDRAFT_480790 [Phlebiopsis gigantea 11061_1 CR5-6]|uniref:Uncharacterized protein n=1 Tax=Phlebiopsis gigantea (strain 11061_1 CR5-6) TaxID=745531 RepID=A0A0C3S960_PHLG1|nr:hypothetical protein PHLGIDRAFT_480790 [Phlebiopsis gigantea 11061_1 CR5-6]
MASLRSHIVLVHLPNLPGSGCDQCRLPPPAPRHTRPHCLARRARGPTVVPPERLGEGCLADAAVSTSAFHARARAPRRLAGRPPAPSPLLDVPRPRSPCPPGRPSVVDPARCPAGGPSPARCSHISRGEHVVPAPSPSAGALRTGLPRTLGDSPAQRSAHVRAAEHVGPLRRPDEPCPTCLVRTVRCSHQPRTSDAACVRPAGSHLFFPLCPRRVVRPWSPKRCEKSSIAVA